MSDTYENICLISAMYDHVLLLKNKAVEEIKCDLQSPRLSCSISPCQDVSLDAVMTVTGKWNRPHLAAFLGGMCQQSGS